MTNTETDKELMARVDASIAKLEELAKATHGEVSLAYGNAFDAWARQVPDTVDLLLEERQHLQAALAASQQECKRLRGVGKHIDTLICQIDPAVADTWPRSRLEALKDIQRLFKKALAQQQGGEGKDGTGIR